MRATARRVAGAADGARAGVFAAACGGDDDGDGGSGGSPASKDDVDLTQGQDVTIAMVTHGDGGSFWAVAKKGAEDGRQADGRHAEVLRVQQRPAEAGAADRRRGDREGRRPRRLGAEPGRDQGLAPEGDRRRASRSSRSTRAPRTSRTSAPYTHVGQTEEIAGEGAGAKFKEAGAKKLLCVIHEQANIGLNQRCDGAKKGFGGDVENLQVKGTEDIQTTLTEIQSKLQSDKSIDAVLALNPDIAVAARDAIKGAGSSAKLGTFDLSGDVVQAIQDGEIEFAVDQQQYLQGYLPVVFLTLNKTNANTVGGGQPVLTGPGFVTKDNAETVAQLAQDGTR